MDNSCWLAAAIHSQHEWWGPECVCESAGDRHHGCIHALQLIIDYCNLDYLFIMEKVDIGVWAHLYIWGLPIWKQAKECIYACFSVCCELSLTPNSLSLIGCVILGEDKEGHWRGAQGGGNRGNERALPITGWPAASPWYKRDSHTPTAHRLCCPCYPLLISHTCPILTNAKTLKKNMY